MNSKNPASPYVGLRPFREEDFPFFFGRDREIRVIASNLQARTLTVLYGASGVGKSSVLQAGIVRRLKDDPGTSVLYFRDWQSDSLVQEIVSRAYELVSSPAGAGAKATPDGSGEPVAPPRERVFLILDQFEEFLLYHASDNLGEEFCSVLSRIVNRKNCSVNVLIGIRDDSLYKLDRRFSIRIPNLLRDTLEVERLSPAGARSAIEKPLIVFTENSGNGKVYGIEPTLVDQVLLQVQTGHVGVSESSGLGARHNRQRENQIETAFLQLVLTKLWEEEQRRDSTNLRLSTLNELGGADNIVRSHVNTVMDQLASDRERDIAANMFRYLVTPSRSKIAQTTKDLISYAEKPEAEVKPVLDALTDRSESRILRRLSDPEQYEIFHDVLAQPLLDWRHEHGEALTARRLWRIAAGAVLVAVLVGALAVYALVERHRARDSAEVARANSLQAEQLQKQAQSALSQLKAEQARREGKENEAKLLQEQADAYAKQAQSITQTYQKDRQDLDSVSKEALDKVQAANRERDIALQNLTLAQKERDGYKSQLDGALQQIKELQEPGKPAQTAANATPGKGKSQSGAQGETDVSSLPPPATLADTVSSPQSTLTLASGTEVCGVLVDALSKNTDVGAPVAAFIFRPPELALDRLEGKVTHVAQISETPGKPNRKYALQIEFDKILHKDRTRGSISTVPIAATLSSVTSAKKNRHLVVDEKNGIISPINATVPSYSDVCILIKKAGS